MPERLKEAIEKARRSRGANYIDGAPPPEAAIEKAGRIAGASATSETATDRAWAELPEVSLDAAAMRKNRIVTSQKTDSSHYNFDVLRTRILMMFRENGWTRLGVTSPTLGCGKTVFSANLALSFSRQPEMRVLLADMDLRSPRIGAYLGLKEDRSMEWFLSGQTPPS
ncbi:MAG: chromosome partitioning ATPase-like protein, partial [Pseudomonadota bacterium]